MGLLGPWDPEKELSTLPTELLKGGDGEPKDPGVKHNLNDEPKALCILLQPISWCIYYFHWRKHLNRFPSGSSHKKAQKFRFTPPGLWMSEEIHIYIRRRELGSHYHW